MELKRRFVLKKYKYFSNEGRFPRENNTKRPYIRTDDCKILIPFSALEAETCFQFLIKNILGLQIS